VSAPTAGSRPTLPAPRRIVRELRTEFPPVVQVLAAGDLVASFGFSLFFPYLTIYLVETLGATAAMAGLVIAAYSLCSIVSGLVGGWLADRIGRRPVLIGSITATAILVASMAFATEVWQVALIFLLLGSIDPAFAPAARAAIADVVPEEHRPRAYGLLGVAAALGWIAGPTIGAGLSVVGYPLLFGVSGALVGGYTLIALRWLPETRPAGAGRHGPRPAVGRPEPRIGADARIGADPEAIGRVGPVERPAPTVAGSGDASASDADRLRRRVFVAFLPLLVPIHAVTFIWVTTLPIHAAGDLEVATPVWGVLFSINGLVIVLFQLRISGLAERRSRPRVLAGSMLLYAAGLGLAAALSPATAVAGLTAVIVLVTLGEMLLMPIEPSLVSDLSPVAHRGAYQGMALAAGSIGAALGPPLTGLALDGGAGGVVWLVAAAILVAVAGALVALARWTDRLPPAPA
jgi:MFS family permease